jgi:hypothetical protein
MTRKSELQRKLESLPAPKPPANLADRIKSEIPRDLRFDVEDEREKLSSGIGLNLRVAASFLILVATAYLGLHVMMRTSSDAPMASNHESPLARRAVATAADTATSMPAIDTMATQSRVIVEQKKQAPARKARVEVATADLRKKEERDSTRAEMPVAPAASEARQQPRTDEETVTLTAEAPLLAAAPSPAPPPPVAAGAATESAQAKPLIAPAQAPAAARSNAPAKTSLAVYDKVSDDSWIERFAAPEVLPTAPVLDVEAVQEPIAPNRIITRVSFDTGVTVRDLWVDTIVSDAARPEWLHAAWPRWGAAQWIRSHTSLVAFALPERENDLVTVRARYRVGDDPIVQTVEKVVHRADVRAWSVASPRMKKTTIAALLQSGGDRGQLLAAARSAGLTDLAKVIETFVPQRP